MANVQDVLAALRANKARRHNYEGASRRFHGKDTVELKNPTKHTRADLGKKIGFCPHCTLVQGDKCIGTECRRCGELITKESVTKNVNQEALIAWRRHDKWGNPSVLASCPYVGFGCLEVD